MYNLEEIIKSTSDIRLLYVEDNEEARTSTLALFREFFKEVVIAVDGEDGLSKFKTHKIDLVISDINMPHMNGLDMIEEIRSKNKEIPILLLSAYSEIEYFKRSISLGVDGYLFKPLELEQFFELIYKIVDKIQTHKALDSKMSFLKQYEEATNDISIVSKGDLDGNITYANDLFCKLSHYTKEELIGSDHNIVRHPDNSTLQYREMWDTIKNKKKKWKGIIRNLTKDGSSYYVDAVINPILDMNGEVVEYIAMRHDITEVMSPKKQMLDFIYAAEKPVMVKISIESYEDLQNYYGRDFSLDIEHDLSVILKSHFPMALGFDNFYNLENGSYAFVKDGCKNIQNALSLLHDFQKTVNNMNINVANIAYDVSILICISYENDVYENVTYGMRQLKSKKEDFLITNDLADSIHKSAQENLRVLNKVKIALEKSKIVSYFQPIVDRERKISKYESLVRLVEEDGNVLSPYFFLDTAKRGKYYTQITSAVLKNSFTILDTVSTSISMNISAIDIEKESVCHEIYLLLEEHKESAHRVVFELLEDEDVKDFQQIRDFINRVKSYGVKIAIDDFGSGYSNYERLLDYQPDIIKIDGTLVKNIATSDFSVSVVNSIVSFAKAQNMEVVAEYVENEEIYLTLMELGVDYFQGYYFGKPEVL
jgi:PAS domain S-box-containing protein